MREYVKEILTAMPKGLTQEEFLAKCRPDINAGYRLEVEQAWRQYNKKRAA